MKKNKVLSKVLIGFYFAIMLFPLVAIAQDSLVVDPTVPIPDGLTDLINYNQWFVDVGAVAGLTVFLTGLLLTYLWKSATKRWRQGAAIVIAIILSVGSDLLNFGYLAEAPLLTAVLSGIGSGFIANGFYNQPEIKAILKWLRLKPKVSAPA
jgi:hypothetical protein